MRAAFASLPLLLPLVAVAAVVEPPVPEEIVFNRDVRPILAENCFACHGPDAGHRKGKLRLDVREEALAREAFVPGKPRDSSLVERIRSRDEDEVMPPLDSHKQLTERDRLVLERWIAQGAAYQRHWAYEAPVKARISPGENAVDVLVGRRLAARGLKPSAAADRRTLLRRLQSDLTGLPPTPVEVEAFVADPAADAYDRAVERLLADPRFGERMALGWLDVVRYADTIGYHSDNPRNVWPYRDWVIASFNANKRFDRFTLEQIAGDLLPDADEATRVGSAFNRLLLSTEEGGAQPKDYEARMLADRVRAIGAAWLGQTTGCAQCHDHKFDPFTMRDFYSLGAFFADVKEEVVGRREEGMLVLSAAERADLSVLEAAVKSAQGKVAAVDPQLQAAEAAWLRGLDAAEPPRELAAVLRKDAARRTARDRQQLRAYFRAHVAVQYRAELDALAAAEHARTDWLADRARCLVTESTPERRVVRILPRGNWQDETGEVVRPALPHYLPQPDLGSRPPDRLDLARWLVAKDNPLTARTVMNRLWKQFFGLGLSRVLDDLGAQGEPPPNAALLDWLACEFMDSGWDVKHMVRLIVTSATYRQSSVASAALLAADPYNREHARQAPFRLEAELVRDQALAVAGLLSPRIGGPSVKPYQPDRYWENLNFPARDYVADRGEAQYRRGLYVWWQRSFLHPSLLAFDAPSREECVAERNRSNLPQQALVLLNDPTYVEAARALAGRIATEGGRSRDERIRWAWRRALQRDPRPEELATAVGVYEANLAVYRADPAAARALLAVGESPRSEAVPPAEHAAWTHVARVLLNLHEFITRS